MKTDSRETAIVVGVHRKGVASWEVEDNLDELDQLAYTAGADPVARLIQDRGKPDPATFLSRGKVSELQDMISLFGAQIVLFDDDLTPAQVKNLEKKVECKVLDRSGLILDIFARRAVTNEAKIQVELAQLQYMLPRLTRRWLHLSRQVGGIGTRTPVGTRGPGETQLEVDRRVVNQRIAHLKRELTRIERARSTRRQRRSEIFKVALIGYTNVGKSTILNALTNANVFVEDLLFATLDPTIRSLRLPSGKRILLIDTVGFIRKLPVKLLASFRSTLEESHTADLFVNIVDLAHPHWEEQLARTEEIIIELKLDKTPQILAFNKVDLVNDAVLLEGLHRQYPEAIFISALRGIRMWELPERVSQFAEKRWVRGTKAFQPDEGEELKDFEKNVRVLGRKFRDGLIIVDYLIELNPPLLSEAGDEPG